MDKPVQNTDGSTDLYFGPDAPKGKVQELAEDRAEQGLFRDHSALWPDGNVLRSVMEAGRHREGELSGEAAHDPPCQSSTRRRAVAQRGRAVRARPDSGARPEGVGRQGPAELGTSSRAKAPTSFVSAMGYLFHTSSVSPSLSLVCLS